MPNKSVEFCVFETQKIDSGRAIWRAIGGEIGGQSGEIGGGLWAIALFGSFGDIVFIVPEWC